VQHSDKKQNQASAALSRKQNQASATLSEKQNQASAAVNHFKILLFV